MIIISQDKMEIYNFNVIYRLYVDDYFNIRAEKSSDNIDCAYLGAYETGERAKEVLTEIYKKYSDWQSMRMIRNEEIQAKIVSGDNSKYFDVYMMPEE